MRDQNILLGAALVWVLAYSISKSPRQTITSLPRSAAALSYEESKIVN